MSARARQGGPVGSATLWMVVLSVLLFWLPTLGALVGGWKAGGVGTALGAAVIPAVVVSAQKDLGGALFDLPVIGGLVGTGVLVVILVCGLPLLVGAIGGSLSASLALYGRRAGRSCWPAWCWLGAAADGGRSFGRTEVRKMPEALVSEGL